MGNNVRPSTKFSTKTSHVSHASTEDETGETDFASIIPKIASDFESMTTAMTSSETFSGSYFEQIEGPGHIQANPISLRDSTRMQLAQVVVGLAVSYITVKMKYEEFTTKFIPALAPRNSTTIDGNMNNDQSFIKLSNGIILQDTIVGNEIIEVGDRVSIESSLFYNGLPVDNINGDLAKNPLLYGSNEVPTKLFAMFKLGKNEGAINNGYEALKGMRMGGKRKLLVPPAQAFGDEGLPPYVPPKAFVVFDIQITPYNPATSGASSPVIDVVGTDI